MFAACQTLPMQVVAIPARSLRFAHGLCRSFTAWLLALTVCCAANSARAVVYTWVPATGNWNVNTNWNPTGVPTTGDVGNINSNTATANASLTGTPDINIGGTGTLTILSLATPATGGTITVNSGGRLQWQGTSTGSASVVLNNGALLSKPQSNALAVSSDSIFIDSGAIVTHSRGNSTVSRTTLGLRLVGPLSSGDANSTLVVNPVNAGFHAPLVLQPTTANTGYTGNVHMQGVGTTRGTLVLAGTGALSNVNNITFGTGGTLRFSHANDPLASGKTVTIPSGARMEWEGNQTYTVTPPTIILQNGSFIGREEDSNAQGTSSEFVQIAAGANVTASRINATVSRSTLGLRLIGPLSSGDSTSTLTVNPISAGFHGALFLQPSTANTGFTGNVVLQGVGTTRGTLVLGGTGALSDVSNLSVENGGQLRFRSATDPLPSGYNVLVETGGRMEWEGTQTYNVTPPVITFQNGSFLGREEDSNAPSFSSETLVLDPAALVTATRINTTISRTDLGLTLRGSLQGPSTSTLAVTGTPGMHGPLMLNPTVANPFTGSVVVNGPSAAARGALVLLGTGPLANAALLDVQDNGTVMVFAAGAADGIDEIHVATGGILRFRNNAGSVLNNTTLTGTGLVRSELVDSASSSVIHSNLALRSLSLNNMTVSPGDSLGTLTIDATAVTMGSNSILEIEVGASSDLLAINGDLILTAGSTLDLLEVAGLGVGSHVIATYSGTLTGAFGNIQSNFSDPWVFASIDYGTMFNGQITVFIAAIPEPGAGASLGCLLLCAAMRRRRARGARRA